MILEPLTHGERVRRKLLIETYLTQGYAPLRIKSGKGSAVEQADKADGKVSGSFARWIRNEERRRVDGRDHVIPDWSLYSGPLPDAFSRTIDITIPVEPTQPSQIIPLPSEEEIVDLDARARILRGEIVDLLRSSNHPVINPQGIVVETTMVRRFDRKAGIYKDSVTTPRTWLSETLRVEPVRDARGRRYLFTAAQNDAPIHRQFWLNLQAYASHLDAEIVVGPLTYETSWWSENNPIARAYAPEIAPHLCFGQMAIGDGFVFCGEMNAMVTASHPVSDLMTYGRNRWAVFPHAKRQLKSVPSTDPAVQSHQVMTTGMVTRPKIIPRKAGVKSLFHGVIGAVLVEFDEEGSVFCRQITAGEDGSFYDLDVHVDLGLVTTDHRAKAIVFGDIHLRKLDPVNAMACFGFDPGGGQGRYRDSMLDVLKPETILLHDVFDNEARNHHHAGDSAYGYELAIRGRGSVGNEIAEVGGFLAKVALPGRDVVVVESNHDLGLERYVREGRYRNDGINTKLGLELETAFLTHKQIVADCLNEGLPVPKFSLLEFAVRTQAGRLVDGVRWAYDGSSLVIDGIEVGHHGFRGTNGSKGTVEGFTRTGRQISIGDKHAPEIAEGVYCAGAMTLQQGYNKGPSTWAVSHIIHYPDGNRAIVTLQNGRWRAKRPRIAIPAQKAAL